MGFGIALHFWMTSAAANSGEDQLSCSAAVPLQSNAGQLRANLAEAAAKCALASSAELLLSFSQRRHKEYLWFIGDAHVTSECL